MELKQEIGRLQMVVSVTPTLRVGVIHDFIKNTLNDKHSFDFQDKRKVTLECEY